MYLASDNENTEGSSSVCSPVLILERISENMFHSGISLKAKVGIEFLATSVYFSKYSAKNVQQRFARPHLGRFTRYRQGK